MRLLCNPLQALTWCRQVVHQHAETDELSMNELDEANGGLFILYLGLCYMAGYGLAAMTERR